MNKGGFRFKSFMYSVICGLIVVVCFSGSVSAAKNYRIVIVHSYHSDYKWTSEQAAGFRKVLGDQYQYSEFFMDTKRLPENMFSSKAAEALKLITDKKPALVYITDDNAFRLVGSRVKDLPVVFSGVNGHLRNDYPWALKSLNVTGVLERPMIFQSLIQVSSVVNITVKNAKLLLGASPTAQAFFNNDLKGKPVIRHKGIRLETSILDTYEEWKNAVRIIKKEDYDALVVAGNIAVKDSKGRHIDVVELDKWLSEHSPLPVLTIHSDQIGKELLTGGVILNGTYMGEDAGSLAAIILENGVSPSELFPRTQKRGTLVFSRSQLNRWGLEVDSAFSGNVILVD